MCDRTKFQHNRPYGFGDIAIFYFQNGRRPPSWILKFLNWQKIDVGDYIGDDSPHAKIQNDRPIGGVAAYAW